MDYMNYSFITSTGEFVMIGNEVLEINDEGGGWWVVVYSSTAGKKPMCHFIVITTYLLQAAIHYTLTKSLAGTDNRMNNTSDLNLGLGKAIQIRRRLLE